jgi:hypothetical protein
LRVASTTTPGASRSVLIDVVGLDHGVVLEVAAADLVAVVRDKQPCLPTSSSETIRRTVVAIDVVYVTAVAVSGAVVVAIIARRTRRCPAGIAVPNAARRPGRSAHAPAPLAGQTRRFQDPAFEHEQDVRARFQPPTVSAKLISDLRRSCGLLTHQRGAADAL